MADNIYDATVDDYGKMVAGTDNWYLTEIYEPQGMGIFFATNGQFVIAPLSLKIGVYARTDANGVTEYALVNKGSSNIENWVNNGLSLSGSSPDVVFSIDYAVNFVNRNRNAEVTMIGHSKGGAEAMYNAVATSRNCITFNPAPTNFLAYGLFFEAVAYEWNLLWGKRTMTHYIVLGEILSMLFGLPVIGSVKLVETQFYMLITVPVYKTYFFIKIKVGEENILVPDPLKNHSMSAFISAWWKEVTITAPSPGAIIIGR